MPYVMRIFRPTLQLMVESILETLPILLLTKIRLFSSTYQTHRLLLKQLSYIRDKMVGLVDILKWQSELMVIIVKLVKAWTQIRLKPTKKRALFLNVINLWDL